MEADNDNEPLSFITLCAATRNVVRYLESNEKQSEQTESNPEPRGHDQEQSAEHREYVAKRLRDLAAFERRANRLGKN